MALTEQKALFVEAPFDGEWNVRKRDIQKPGHGEVLVKVHAASLNPVDYYVPKMNLNPTEPNGPPLKYPLVLGYDSAGTVEEIGDGVDGLEKGDPVCVWVLTQRDEH